MGNRIVYTNDEGNVVIMQRLNPNKTDEDVTPNDRPYVIVDESEIPVDRYFRNAWKLEGSTIKVDRVKAKSIKLEKIRQLRDIKLEGTDIKLMIACESGNTDTEQTLIIERQALRDLPANINLNVSMLPTIEDLKNFYPAELL